MFLLQHHLDEIEGANYEIAAYVSQSAPVTWKFVNQIKTWHAWARLHNEIEKKSQVENIKMQKYKNIQKHEKYQKY